LHLTELGEVVKGFNGFKKALADLKATVKDCNPGNANELSACLADIESLKQYVDQNFPKAFSKSLAVISEDVIRATRPS
jgi:hypothetical protein